METSDTLRNSTDEQDRLRTAALWAADCAEKALPVFEDRHPDNPLPREAIEAGRAFGRGKKRDKNLRVIALAVFKIVKELDEPSKHAARAASLTAAVAYTHTDLQTGLQGIRQARHLLGPVVHTACALESAADGDTTVGDDIIRQAIASAPPEVKHMLEHMEPQPSNGSRLDHLFSALDSALRS